MGQLGTDSQITVLLNRWQSGDRDALEELMALVYHQLSLMAHRFMKGEKAGHTFSTADLVSEVYLSLFNGYEQQWEDRAHFFAFAGKAMRNILINYAARKNTLRRGGSEFERVIVEIHELRDRPQAVLTELDEAMERLKQRDSHIALIVELRFFCGFTIDQIAESTLFSTATVKRKLKLALVWLDRYLQ